jgi:hypothetical protein
VARGGPEWPRSKTNHASADLGLILGHLGSAVFKVSTATLFDANVRKTVFCAAVALVVAWDGVEET